jgi:membrane protein implicated in regulation of membrane protease activity
MAIDFVKLSKFQMIFWFAMAALTLILLSIAIPMGMFPPSYFFVPVVCVVMALLRRWQLKRVTKSSAEKTEREKNS